MSINGALVKGTQGADAQGRRLDATASNIGNVSTTGYKKRDVQFSSFVTGASGGTSTSAGVNVVVRNFVNEQGLVEETGRATDLAISGKGFFAVQDEAANLFFTRAGSFDINNRGELENAAGFKLLGWPLDNDGRIPGEVGNQNTTPAESTESLEIVDINAISGTASATTTVSAGLNLNAGQATFQGATVTIDLVSTENSSSGQDEIIIPSTAMMPGDALGFQLGSNPAVTFIYGGFEKSRIVGVASAAIFGAETSTASFSSGIADGETFTIQSNSMTTAATFTYKASSPDTLTGQFNSMSTLATTINNTSGLLAKVANSNQIFISATDANDGLTFVNGSSNTNNLLQGLGFSNLSADATGRRFNTLQGLDLLMDSEDDFGSTINNPTSSTTLNVFGSDPQEALTVIKTEDSFEIDLSSFENGTNDLTDIIAPMSGTSTFVRENTAAIAAGSTLTISDGTSSGTFVYGGILQSVSIASTSADLGLTNGVDAIEIGGVTFTYNAALGAQQFTTIDNLATAINTEGTLKARVVNNRLYVATNSAANANAAIAIGAASTAPAMAAIGGDMSAVATPVAAYGGVGNRFSTLEQLDALIDALGSVTSTATGTGTSTQLVVASDTANSQMVIGGANNAGMLDDMTIAAGNVGDGFFTETNLATIVTATDADDQASVARSYDPTDDSNKNMAGGSVAPHFSRNVRIFDSLGSGHDFRLSFLKTGTNEWALEFYSIDTNEITNGGEDGIVASGTVLFNGDGSLRDISGSIASAITVQWANGAESNSVTFNLGTAGLPASIAGDSQQGLTDGLRQFDSSFNVEFVEQNGVAAGQFNNISIDEDGFVNANFTNGEVKRIFQIPMVIVANDNALRELSGNIYQTTEASGEANLKVPGQGDAGNVVPSSLETSTADIAEELTKTIPTQANYNANLRVITTADEMLERLTSI